MIFLESKITKCFGCKELLWRSGFCDPCRRSITKERKSEIMIELAKPEQKISYATDQTNILLRLCEDLEAQLKASYTPQQARVLTEIESILNEIEQKSIQIEKMYSSLKNTSSIKKYRKKGLPPQLSLRSNRGMKWSEEDDLLLQEEFRSGKSIKALAEMMWRSELAIQMRLHKFGLLSGFVNPYEKTVSQPTYKLSGKTKPQS